MEAELTGDEKERAEHAMLVDLERNDLGKVSRFGTVDVAEYRRVDRYSEVMHLVSLIEGRRGRTWGSPTRSRRVSPAGRSRGAPSRGRWRSSTSWRRRGGAPTPAPCSRPVSTGGRRSTSSSARWSGGRPSTTCASARESSTTRARRAEYEETLAKARALVTAVDEALAAGGMAVEEGVDR